MRFVVRRTSVPLSSGLPEWFTWDYDRVEILVDAIVHACGLAGGIVGATVLAALVSQSGLSLRSASVLVYATGLLAMLSLSTAYNLWPVSPVKWILRRFDHSTIYLFIAATYTPFLTHSAPSEIPVVTLAAVWVLAIVGAVLKMLLPGRLERLSIGFYFLVGWTGLAAYRYEMALPPDALQLIALGGLLYSAGVIVHLWHSLRFQNAICMAWCSWQPPAITRRCSSVFKRPDVRREESQTLSGRFGPWFAAEGRGAVENATPCRFPSIF